jgi:anaerobic selenocysteine-containing dehydrogenase
MTPTQENAAQARCTQCPALCELSIVQSGPDNWRIEFPTTSRGGLCPRGGTLGGLLNHRERLLYAAVRDGDRLRSVDITGAANKVADAAKVAVLLDSCLPIEELQKAAACSRAAKDMTLALVIEPQDEAMLTGIAASGAELAPANTMADCDGFLIIGDVFAANPTAARAVFDARAESPRMNIVTIDPASGTTFKFGSQRLATAPCGELAVLSAVAVGAGVKKCDAMADATDEAALAAGKALAKCKKPGVLIAAEFGRTKNWKQIGYVAGLIAASTGGVISPQPNGANTTAAIALREELGTVSVAEALASDAAIVALGCDVIGLGLTDRKVAAAGAALINETTKSADVIFPTALAAEVAGHAWVPGDTVVEVPALMAPPAGVPTAADIVELIAKARGASGIKTPPCPAELRLPKVDAPGAPEAEATPAAPVLLLGRDAMHSGCGAITRHGSWQTGMRAVPRLRIGESDAAQCGCRLDAPVTVSADGTSVEAKVSSEPEMASGVVVLSDSRAENRRLLKTGLPVSVKLKAGKDA